MKPVGRATSPSGGTPSRCPCCPATAPRGRTSTPRPGPTGTARSQRVVRPAQRRRATPSWSAGCRWAASLVLRLAADRGDQVAGHRRWSTRPSPPRGNDVEGCCPVLKHLVPCCPAIGNDIKKPGGDEHGLPQDAAQGAAHVRASSGSRSSQTCRASPSRCSIFRSVEDHVVDSSSVPIITSRVSSRDVTERAARGQLPRGHPRQRRRRRSSRSRRRSSLASPPMHRLTDRRTVGP